MWNKAVSAQNYHAAYSIDLAYYFKYVKSEESLENWKLWQGCTFQRRKSLTSSLPNLIEHTVGQGDGIDRIAVYLPNFSGLAHEEVIASSIRYLRHHNYIPGTVEVHVVFAFGSGALHKPIAVDFYTGSAASIHFLDAQDISEASRSFNILESRYRFRSVIYPSIFFFAFWSSLQVSHPNQKFIVGKYYPLQTGRLTAFAGGRVDEKMERLVNDEKWIQLSFLSMAVKGVKSSKNAEFHDQARTFGSISRVEKTQDSCYTEFILEMLSECPEVMYLYTAGTRDYNKVPAAIRNNPRSLDLGWVDPPKAITSFTVYLEPFPFGGGLMSYLAVRSGLPYLVLVSDQMLEMGISNQLSVIANESQSDILRLSFCFDTDALKDRLKLLISDIGLRRKLGDDWSKAVANYVPGDLGVWKSFYLE
jgi:hypothetical protein